MSVDQLDRVVLIAGHRSWRRRLRDWRRRLIAVGVLVVLAFVAWVVYFSPWLAVDSIDVQGAPSIPRREVLAAADLSTGTPLARVDVDAIRRRVEDIPAVDNASVSRKWPHEVVITVQARQPLALIRHDGAWWVMDRDGVPFARSTGRTADQPIVELDGSAGPRILPSIGAVIGALPADLRSTTRRVTASSPDSITLMLKDGRDVRWGSAAESATKVRVLTALLKHRAQVYDVTIPSQPATSGG